MFSRKTDKNRETSVNVIILMYQYCLLLDDNNNNNNLFNIWEKYTRGVQKKIGNAI